MKCVNNCFLGWYLLPCYKHYAYNINNYDLNCEKCCPRRCEVCESSGYVGKTNGNSRWTK